MTFSLRPYQEKIVEDLRGALRQGVRSMIVVLPTGGGKTAISASVIGSAASRGNSAWFINHRRELIRQSSRTFSKVGIDHGIVSAGFAMDRHSPIQIAGIQTLVNRLDQLKAPKIIFWDECHHIAAGTWTKIFALYQDAIHIGVTATPCRLDGAGLGDWFEHMVEGPTMKGLIADGYLSKYRLFGAAPLDLTGVKSRGGDFVTEQVASIVDNPRIIGDAVKHYHKHCPGAPNIVFATNIAHSMHIVEQYREAGYSAVHLDGTTPQDERDRALRDFERGNIKVLSNVDLFGEGFDVPGIVAVTLLRPTKSTGLYLQQVGRALRPADGKDRAIIFDHADNWVRHGMPDDDRTWSLDPKVKNKRAANDDAPPYKQCPQCYCTHEPAPNCPECGYEYVVTRSGPRSVDGELVEIDPELVKRQRNREQSAAKTLDELIQLGRDRNYKYPVKWARHVIASRSRRGDHQRVAYG